MIPKARYWLVGIGVLWVVLQLGGVLSEYKLPATDVFLFKEAGVNLAEKGHFVASNLPHMPADTELFYSYYPPLYPFTYGMWSKVFGVGLKQSMVFDLMLRTLRTVLLLLFLAPFIRFQLGRASGWKLGVSIVACLVALSFISSDGDRPDELAIIFGLMSWYLCRNGEGMWAFSFGCGLCLGLCAATSPAAGLFFGVGTLLFLWNGKLKASNLALCIAISVTTLLVCSLPVHMGDAYALDRFTKQVPLSNFPYKLPLVGGNSFGEFWTTFSAAISHSLSVGGPYIFCALILAIAGFFAWRKREDKEWLQRFYPPFVTALLFLPMFVFVWSLQPYYLWFSCVALSVMLLGLAICDSRKKYRLSVVFAVLIAFAPVGWREFKAVLHTLQQPQATNQTNISQKIMAHVDVDDKLAVMPDQYFTFRGVKNVSNISYVCDRLDEFEYVYVTPNTSSRNRPNPLPIPCGSHHQCFTVAENLTSDRIFKVLGMKTPYYVKGSGGVLYKNTRCATAKKEVVKVKRKQSFLEAYSIHEEPEKVSYQGYTDPLISLD